MLTARMLNTHFSRSYEQIKQAITAVTHAQSLRTPLPGVNPMHWLVGHVVVCALTTNLKQANAPGNVLLEAGEANLPKQSAVVVSKVSAVDKSHLGEHIGTLSHQRIKQILAGMRFLQASFFTR